MIRNDFMFTNACKIKRHFQTHFLVSYSDGVLEQTICRDLRNSCPYISTFCFSRSCTPDLVP